MISTLLAQRTFWLEPPASTGAQNHDLVFYALLYTMTFFFFLVIGIMLLFVVLYRRRKGDAPEGGPTHNTPLEIFWTVIPLIVVIAFFVVGLKYYVDLEAPPAGADVVEVEASQWQFNFKYPNGAESNELYLQLNRPVVLKLSSKDVTHALYIPVFRVQRNAVPGRITEIWFKPTELSDKEIHEAGEEGYYHVFCTQYCGNGHAEMHAKAFVLSKEAYETKLADAANIFVDKNTKQPLPYAEVGKKLYLTMGCSSCHSIDGKAATGPTWMGLYKSNVEFSKSDDPGYTLKKSDDEKKWDDYLRESILHPEVKIVNGLDASGNKFENKMPSQESSFSGSAAKEMKLKAIIEYIKSLGDPNDYKPMKTPELPGADQPPKGDSAKPQTMEKPSAAVREKAPATEALKPPATDRPPVTDRFADRPAEPPVDRSKTSPQPLPNQDEKKKEEK